jgi:transposase
MDVHKASIAVTYVAKDHDAAVISLGTFGTRQCDIDILIWKLPSQAKHLVFVYAAGPCGSWLSRYLTNNDAVCWVVAPSCMPTKAGDRVNPDRRDAMPLARLMRSGDLTPVSGPALDDEAIRDLRRARAETLRDLQAATLRLQACLLRHDLRSTGRAHWSPAHLRWRSAVVCPTPAQQSVLPAYVQTVTAPTERLGRLALARHEQVTPWRFAPVVEALQALRRVQCTVAVTTVAELGDRTRCEHPRQRMHSLGLTPAEYARGARRQQGSIPQTGHAHARRALVAGAWAYRYPAQISQHLHLRLEKLPTAIQASSWKAQVRLCQRDRQLMAKGKNAHQVVVAMARA